MMIASTTSARITGIAILFAAIVGNVGCTSISSWKPSKMFSLDNTWPFKDKDKPHEGTPVRMVGTWTDTVLTEAGKKPQRGFGGRIMFYEKDEKNPVLVEGQLVVYAFDETGRDPTDTKPTRRYVFPTEQVPKHMSKSELGASYSFWLPWDEAGGPKTEISLICRFEPKGGAVITSEQTKHILPGSTPVLTAGSSKKPPKLPEGVAAKPMMQTLQSLQAQRTEGRLAQQASYEVPADPLDPQAAAANAAQDASLLPSKRMTATTINLPSSYQLPSAAALMNQAAPTPNNMQAASQVMQQPLANQMLPPQSSAMTQAVQASAGQQLGMGRPVMGAQLQMSTNGFAPQLSQLPVNAQATVMPGAPQVMQGPAPFTTNVSGQIPIMQPQLGQQSLQQQPTLQQQMLVQQLAQQQRMSQTQLPAQPVAQPYAAPTIGTAAVSSPAAAQYLR